MRRIVFESAIFRGIMRGGDDHTVGKTLAPVLMGGQDGSET